ncbi:MAG: transposase [Sphaerochaeta sp.]|jgi:hypothetical protein|nr:transposase [Sphaerochaeta sp.]
MAHSTPPPMSLQSLLFRREDFSGCFFREPSEREREFLSYFHAVQSLVSPDELRLLRRRGSTGREGYGLLPVLGIQVLKLHYRLASMKEALLLLKENECLREMLGLSRVPSAATVSRLSRLVERIVQPSLLHERLIRCYSAGLGRMAVGHLSIDSTIIEAREKPLLRQKPPERPHLKKGRKKKGSEEEREYQERMGRQQREREACLAEEPENSFSALEMRCSVTAKQNAKGTKQWFVGYKAHLAVDDFGVPLSYALTGACVHDSTVAVPLMKMVRRRTDFFYALMDKGYQSPAIEAYAALIGRRVIVDRRSTRSGPPVPLDAADALRYMARTTVERTNSELKDGFLPAKMYRRGSQARYDIELAILLTTLKMAGRVLRMKQDAATQKAA